MFERRHADLHLPNDLLRRVIEDVFEKFDFRLDETDAAGTHVEAQKGETLIRTATGERRLAAGETAVLEPNGTIDVMEKAPAHAKVAIAAGESPVLHDPKAPTPVRIAFGCGAAVVELAKDRSFKKVVSKSRGTGGANVLVPAGSFVYRVLSPATVMSISVSMAVSVSIATMTLLMSAVLTSARACNGSRAALSEST